jgi:hypothetical protein
MYLLIMGRLIISETEKKNILSLYESTNVVPSPSESILVANKNPFNDDEYISYRKSYNKDLKNGDGFFVLDEKKYNKWVNSIAKQFLIGKTINLKSDSGDEKSISIPIFNSITPNLRGGNSSLKELFFKNNTMTFSIYIITDGSGLGQVKYYDIKANEYYYLPQESKEKLFKIINENYTWDKVPDDFFELRKVQKKQTDF